MLAIFSRKTNIAVSNAMCANQAHGVVWARPIEIDENDTSVVAEGYRLGGVTSFRFRADSPRTLRKPLNSTLMDIRQQLLDIGLMPTTIEVNQGNNVKVYAL